MTNESNKTLLIIAGVLVLVGIVLGHTLLASGSGPALLLVTTGALFTAGVVVGLYAVAFKSEMDALRISTSQAVAKSLFELHASLQHQLVAQLDLAQQCEEFGLVGVHSDCTKVDYDSLLLGSRKLVIVLNDGRTWASVHRDRLRQRFTDPTLETTVILIHPDSPMLQVLARKGSKDIEVIQSRIRETVQLLEEIRTRTTSLEILGHHLFNPHAVVVGDAEAIVTPSFLSRGGRTVPAFNYRDTGKACYYRDIIDDIERLRMDAQHIGTIPKNQGMPEIITKIKSRA